MRDVYIINPAAGKQDSTAFLKEQLEIYYGDDCKVLVTCGVGDALLKARAEAQTGDEVRIFACGGDGTAFEVLNGIVGYENASLGIIPTGSANDFIKFFGSDSKKYFLNIEKQKYGKAVPIDIIKAGDRYCLNQCCAGMDAMVADDMNLFKRLPLVSGPMAYKLSIVRTFLRRLGIRAKITADGQRYAEGRLLFAVCANAPVYGGGYISSPNADPFDGRLNCLTVGMMSRFQALGFLSLYKNGQHEGLKVCRHGECSSFELTADKPVPVSLDGEIIHTEHIRCEIVGQGVKLVLPDGLSDMY